MYIWASIVRQFAAKTRLPHRETISQCWLSDCWRRHDETAVATRDDDTDRKWLWSRDSRCARSLSRPSFDDVAVDVAESVFVARQVRTAEDRPPTTTDVATRRCNKRLQRQCQYVQGDLEIIQASKSRFKISLFNESLYTTYTTVFSSAPQKLCKLHYINWMMMTTNFSVSTCSIDPVS